MPNDSIVREYNWEDILVLLCKDMGVDPMEGMHEIWYLGMFNPPQHTKDKCIRFHKHDTDFQTRLDENIRDKVR